MAAPLNALVVCARAGGILILGAAAGLALAAARPGGLQLRPAASAASCEAPAVAPTILSAAEAAKICAADRVLIADARSAEAFTRGHIAGAVHLPCDARGGVAGAALAHLADRTLVLVYGETTDEALTVARSIAQRLPAVGPRVFALAGGFPAWERAGLACASGPCDSCEPRSSGER